MMLAKEWSEKLTSVAKQQYMRSPFWLEAASRKLTWEEAVMDKPSIQEAVNRLDEASAGVLRAFYICFGAGPVSEERLFSSGVQRAGLSGAEFRYGLIQLQNAGIVFALRKGWGERLYALPSDGYMLWHAALFPIPQLSAADTGYGQWEQRQEDTPHKSLGRQLLSVWAELARSGLGLTAKGTLPKKTATKLMQAVTITEEEMMSAGWKTEPEASYNIVLTFILKLSMHLGVVTTQENRMGWNEQILTKWLSEPDYRQEFLLLQWCQKERFEGKPGMWHAMAVLARLEPGIWYAERDLTEQIKRHGLDAIDWDRHLHSCLDFLRLFGWMELGRTEQGTMMRFTMMPLLLQEPFVNLKAVHEPIFIEPNGDLFVTPGCSPLIRWELELIADKKSDDLLSIWQINRQSAMRALAHGRTTDQILAFLHAAAGGVPISPLLESSLLDWGKQEDGLKAAAEPYPLLPFDPPADCQFLLRSSAGALASCELMNHEDFTVERFLPELDRVPLSWLQQLRSYHHSTRLEILEQALSWQAPVQLSMDEAVVAFVPARVDKSDNGWRVTGLLREAATIREVCLTPEMWQGMKLVAPGVSGFV
ncbi:hypothetical protein [Paenibacillus glycanilyticus]|uniref:Helicase XPB/Ssl2 N-terminal domain-containing protein n=1 Tax=Paenibacillus glycanilyticus TaxID=126569 RepID=A0ABQ6GE56_9BACL|nr:hypothetical protein [Paenibacillus glycanilyticus]GLX68380.1 hypothetical protein MU1_27250 [Paenibacillus glycanilyticus]